METAVFIAKAAFTAYSAVTAVKALKEGNIAGAVLGGFGAYMGLANLGAFNTAVAGDALAQSAAAETTGGGFLAGLDAAEGATGDLFTGFGGSEFTTEPLKAATGLLDQPAIVQSGASVVSAAPDIGSIGAPVALGQTTGGFMSAIENGWNTLVETGEAVVNEVGDLISTKDGSLLAKAGEAVGGSSNLLNLAKMGAGYLAKDRAQDKQIKAAKEMEERVKEEAARRRSSIGAAPSYVYDFGRRKVSV